MKSQTDLIKDPFDILDMDSKIVPMMSKDKLSGMIDHALEHEQIVAPVTRRPEIIFSRTGWWSGGLATAACLVLLLTVFPMPQTPIQKVQDTATLTPSMTTQISGTASSFNEDDDLTVSDLMLYDTLDSF